MEPFAPLPAIGLHSSDHQGEHIMRALIAIAIAASVLAGSAASAQTTSFRGFRVEANAGGDRFQSQGEHRDKFGYGGTVGFDGLIGDRVVVGPEASYWRANEWTENSTAGVSGGRIDHKSFEEFGAAVRAGYLFTPSTLIFVKGGYVSNEQRKSFTAPVGQTSFYNNVRSDGYQVGGGIEQTFGDTLYANAQYVYSNYYSHTARQRAMVGVGVRFK